MQDQKEFKGVKRPAYLILALFIIICCNSAASFAAMDESVSSEDIIESIIYAREKAKQEYQVYRLQKESQKKAPMRAEAPAISEKTIVYSSRKDVAIAMVSIIIAIILSLKLYQLSKKKALKGETYKKEV